MVCCTGLKPRALVLAAALFAGSVLHAQSTPKDALLVLSKKDRTVSIVDPANLKVLTRVSVGDDPHEVVASTDGKTAYISNYGGGALHTLAVVDLVRQRALPSIDLGLLGGPHGLAFVGGKTWFTAEAAKVIGSYSPATGKVDWILGTGQNRTHMIYVADDRKRIITTNVSSGTVSFIEKITRAAGPGMSPANGPGPARPMGPPRDDWDETVVKVGNGAEGFDVSPDGKELWVGNALDGTISIVDIATKRVIQTLSANAVGANRLKFTPDGRLAFLSTLRGSDLIILDTASRQTVKRLKIGHGAAGILMQPDGARAFVACTPDDYVVVVDLKSLEVTGKIDAGPQPDGLAWAVRR
ncbi:MAG TPA: hypothetical protein VM554_13565 [Acidisarcina sp.]|nr:hypothetical protein [Acidisarcina sp.]